MKNLDRIYYKLYNHFGPQYWWPASSAMEMIIGSVLVQNTNWNNVTQALDNFETFDPEYLRSLNREMLIEMIRPAGFYTRKSQTILNVLAWLNSYDFDFDVLNTLDTEVLRNQILGIAGIGPETCDCILLYTFDRPVFVVDAYLKRLLLKMGFDVGQSYEAIQGFMMDNLPHDVLLFQEYHALVVAYGKAFSKEQENDPLKAFESVIDYRLSQLNALQKHSIMKDLVTRFGYVERRSQPDPYWGIIYAIVGQLISTQAANAILLRFTTQFPTLASVVAASFDELKAVGLTQGKTEYISTIATLIQNKHLDLKALEAMDDETALKHLMQLKGIGPWSAKIVLMHSYHRLNFAIYEDVALRNAVKSILGCETLERTQFDAFFEPFEPYKTIVCIYLWRLSATL